MSDQSKRRRGSRVRNSGAQFHPFGLQSEDQDCKSESISWRGIPLLVPDDSRVPLGGRTEEFKPEKTELRLSLSANISVQFSNSNSYILQHAVLIQNFRFSSPNELFEPRLKKYIFYVLNKEIISYKNSMLSVVLSFYRIIYYLQSIRYFITQSYTS